MLCRFLEKCKNNPFPSYFAREKCVRKLGKKFDFKIRKILKVQEIKELLLTEILAVL